MLCMCRIKQKSTKEEFLSFLHCIGNFIDMTILWIRKLWYIILMSISTPYVIRNFEEIVEFQFFTEFNGKNLIFLVWVVLLIVPLFDSFEGFGISIKRFYQRSEDKQLNALAENNVIPSQTELERQLTDESK